MQLSTPQVTHQIAYLNSRLPNSFKGRSLQSDKDLLLMRLELARREYNRINKENLDFYTYCCMLEKVYYNNDVLVYLELMVYLEDRSKEYLRRSNYKNNKKVKL